MKREEAIEVLKDLYGAIEDNHGRDYDEAFRMAIEALSVESSRKWETCFSCPLSKGCPQIQGKSNDEIAKYASKIPNGCPLSMSTDGDLISRADALEQMAQAECGVHYNDCEADNCCCSYIGRILDISSVEAVSREEYDQLERLYDAIRTYDSSDELVQGEWIHNEARVYTCSECGTRHSFISVKPSNYCPNCGARMKSEVKDI